MRATLLITLTACATNLSAQQMDTVFLKQNKNFKYMVFDKAIKGNGPVSYYDSTGTLRATMQWKHRKLDGEWVKYDPNGRVWAVGIFRKGRAEGVIRSYWPNGELAWTMPYRKGKLDGECVLMDSTGASANGDIMEEFFWGGGQAFSHCVNGRPEGKVVVKHDGRIVSIGNYNNGLANGVYVFYNQAGTPVRKDTYKNGHFIKSEELNL